jgi:hypothetical protein
MRVESGQIQNVNVSNIVKRKANEEKRLREMTIPKKQKRLYDKIKFSQKKKRQEVCVFFRFIEFNRLSLIFLFRLKN